MDAKLGFQMLQYALIALVKGTSLVPISFKQAVQIFYEIIF